VFPAKRRQNDLPRHKVAAVPEVLIGPGGARVLRILVQRHLDRPVREVLRLRRGTFVADCATVAEVAQLIDLAALEPEQRGTP